MAPHRRPVNTVFQSYALFPFLDVADNVAFGLRYQHATRQEVRRRVGAALDHVQMGAFAHRKPHQLSGGQQQRVALARALVLEPTVLLLDEPMGALDAKLRKQLQLELRSLQRLVGTTFVYVTHDQEEALTMSDRLAVLHAGRVMQVGTPGEVYSRPASSYVATFLGTTNLFAATVTAIGAEGTTCRVGETLLAVAKSEHDPGVGDEVSLMVRPERVEVMPCSARRLRAHIGTGRRQRPAGPGRRPHLPGRAHRRDARLRRSRPRGRRTERPRRAPAVAHRRLRGRRPGRARGAPAPGLLTAPPALVTLSYRVWCASVRVRQSR